MVIQPIDGLGGGVEDEPEPVLTLLQRPVGCLPGPGAHTHLFLQIGHLCGDGVGHAVECVGHLPDFVMPCDGRPPGEIAGGKVRGGLDEIPNRPQIAVRRADEQHAGACQQQQHGQRGNTEAQVGGTGEHGFRHRGQDEPVDAGPPVGGHQHGVHAGGIPHPVHRHPVGHMCAIDLCEAGMDLFGERAPGKSTRPDRHGILRIERVGHQQTGLPFNHQGTGPRFHGRLRKLGAALSQCDVCGKHAIQAGGHIHLLPGRGYREIPSHKMAVYGGMDKAVGLPGHQVPVPCAGIEQPCLHHLLRSRADRVHGIVPGGAAGGGVIAIGLHLPPGIPAGAVVFACLKPPGKAQHGGALMRTQGRREKPFAGCRVGDVHHTCFNQVVMHLHQMAGNVQVAVEPPGHLIGLPAGRLRNGMPHLLKPAVEDKGTQCADRAVQHQHKQDDDPCSEGGPVPQCFLRFSAGFPLPFAFIRWQTHFPSSFASPAASRKRVFLPVLLPSENAPDHESENVRLLFKADGRVYNEWKPLPAEAGRIRRILGDRPLKAARTGTVREETHHGRNGTPSEEFHRGSGRGRSGRWPHSKGPHPLPAGTQRLSAHWAHQGARHRFRHSGKIWRPVQPAFRRHEPRQGGCGIRGRHHGRHPLAWLRLGRPPVLRFRLFRTHL